MLSETNSLQWNRSLTDTYKKGELGEAQCGFFTSWQHYQLLIRAVLLLALLAQQAFGSSGTFLTLCFLIVLFVTGAALMASTAQHSDSPWAGSCRPPQGQRDGQNCNSESVSFKFTQSASPLQVTSRLQCEFLTPFLHVRH